MSLICWGHADGSVCLVSLSKIKLEPRRVQWVQSVWRAQEFALHILNTWLKSKLLAEITSIWAFNWKAKKFKFCLSRKLPVEAAAYLEKSKRIGDSSNGIVWFLFGCPGWNLIVLHMKAVISSCRITFRSLLRYNYLAEKLCEEETEDKIYSISKLWFLCHCFTWNVVVTSCWKTQSGSGRTLSRQSWLLFWSSWPCERFIWRLW